MAFWLRCEYHCGTTLKSARGSAAEQQGRVDHITLSQHAVSLNTCGFVCDDMAMTW